MLDNEDTLYISDATTLHITEMQVETFKYHSDRYYIAQGAQEINIMTMELTDEQESKIDEIRWQSEEALEDGVELRKDVFAETVADLREEMKDDIEELRRESKDELEEEIRVLEESWR